ncbi:transglutaminase domain-containing protein [Pleurocapsales cyanobacterium LEGE 10410]|nr:transglutaminase domain-containing protein [Pleurocapsales cyanobacterium LEGE 10410]
MVSSSGRATAPLSIKKTRYPGIDGVMQAATDLVAKYTGDERIRSLALNITHSVRKHSATGQPDLRNVDLIADAIYKWMVRNINYVRDPWNIERIQSPDVTIRQKAGDCDDHAILGASLLQSLGIQTGFRIVSRTGNHFDHIYAVYQSPAGWKSFDTTVLKYPGYAFDERLIKKSRHIPNRLPDGLGFDPITAVAAIASTVSTGISAKNTLSQIFAAGDKDERQRNYLMQQGVSSEVISYSHTENHILQRYAETIDELGKPAVDHLNRFGNLPDSFVASQRAKNSKRKMTLYIGVLAGGVLLTGAVIWSIKQ